MVRHNVGPEKMKRIITMALLLCASGCAMVEPESVPPDLALVRILKVPSMLEFNATSHLSVGTNIAGFVVLAFAPKVEKKILRSGEEVTVDVSTLTVKRGYTTINLVRNRPVGYVAYTIHLVDQSDGKNYTVCTEQDITIGSRRLRLREVNVKELNCTLEDLESGEQFTIKRMAQPDKSSVRAGARR